MTIVKLHFDGWLALPEELRERLGLSTGDRLAIELVEGGVMLRPADGRTDRPPQAPAVEAAPAKRPRGRPRKNPVTVIEVKAAAEPDPAPEPVVEAPILRKKADRNAAAAVQEEPVPFHPRFERPAFDEASFVERRPFRQVEVRKLGPGRGHNLRRSRTEAAKRVLP